MKRCSQCHKHKLISEFGIDNSRKDKHCHKCKECCKINRQKYKEMSTIYGKRYREKNKEQCILYNKQYYLENKEVLLKRTKNYYVNNREQRLQYINDYWKKHPDKHREHSRKRRAIKHGVEEHYTKEDRKYTMDLFDHQCAVCGSTHDLCIDHHYPLSKGYALSRTNAVVLCTKHNLEKYNIMPEDFYTEEQLLFIEEKLSH